MTTLTIKHRFTDAVLFEAEAETIRDVVVKAVAGGANLNGADLNGADLIGANLSRANLSRANLSGAYLSRANLIGAYLNGADLSRANLSGANLIGANLSGAYLIGAYLSRAYLNGADLSGANLSGANLNGADLYGADLSGANLSGARINWNSHDLIAELLRRAAGPSVAKRKVAGLILVSRDWCWDTFTQLSGRRHYAWALATLRPFVQDGDNAPGLLRDLPMPGMITGPEKESKAAPIVGEPAGEGVRC